jgi:hypothetical protein
VSDRGWMYIVVVWLVIFWAGVIALIVWLINR